MPREDFEDLRRQFEKQFGKVRGKFSAARILRFALLGVVIIVVLVGVFSSYYTVATDEVGVVLRLGRYSTTTEPGLHFKIPFGVDTVTPVKVDRVHKEEFGFRTLEAGQRSRKEKGGRLESESLMLTADLGIAQVEWIVQYKINDARKFLFNVKNVAANGQPSTLRDVGEHVLRLEVGDSSIDEVLTLRRNQIAVESKRRIQEILDSYESGIEIVTVELQSVNPPKEVQDSFNEVNRAIQEKQTSINVAHRAWNKEIPAATGDAAKMLEEAEGYKTRRVNEARGDVARFDLLLEEYAKAKEVTRTRLYLEAIEEVLPSISTVYIVDSEREGPLQVLDLEKAAAARKARGAESQSATGRPTRSQGGKR